MGRGCHSGWMLIPCFRCPALIGWGHEPGNGGVSAYNTFSLRIISDGGGHIGGSGGPVTPECTSRYDMRYVGRHAAWTL